jgi:peptidoglycan/xylan/chitin deacetylase (PgdA/CDA1 family)
VLLRLTPFIAGLAFTLGLMPALAQDASDSTVTRAVILMYSRFGEDAYPNASIRIEQFEEHLQELKDGGYQVLPVPEIVAALAAKQKLPEHTVGITVDEAYLSTYTVAWPRLRAAGFPFTLFVATDSVDRGRGDTMSWDQIREMQRAGVTIGSLTASHPHMIEEDRAYNLGQIVRANERFRTQLGEVPTLFAYPYGEFSPTLEQVIKTSGFVAAFGQQSGVAHSRHDLMTLPRFSLSDTYGGMERFRTAVQALPLIVSDFEPADMIIDETPPVISFTVDPMMGDLSTLACFIGGVGRVPTLINADRHVDLQLTKDMPTGRIRMNCTQPTASGRWRWYGAQLTVPGE